MYKSLFVGLFVISPFFATWLFFEVISNEPSLNSIPIPNLKTKMIMITKLQFSQRHGRENKRHKLQVFVNFLTQHFSQNQLENQVSPWQHVLGQHCKHRKALLLTKKTFNVSFTLSVECDATIFSRTFFTRSHDDIEAKIHTGIVFVLTARIQEC